MIVDVKSDIISLDIPPEDYQVIYQIEDNEDRNKLFLFLNSLLTFKISKIGEFSSSIFDFFILRDHLKPLTTPITLNLTSKALDVCKRFLLQLQECDEIKAGKWNDRIKSTLKNQPYEDQKSAAAFLLARKRAGNFSSVGIGKTITSLTAFNILKNEHKIVNGLVFVFNENKDTWRDELELHTNYKFTIVGNGSAKVLEDIENFNEDLLVVHYDCLLNEDIRFALIQKNFDFWIVDEAHTLRNADKKKKNKETHQFENVSQRAGYVYELQEAMNPTYVFPMTGTPVAERPLDSYGILKLLKPNLIPSRAKFEEHFCNFIKIKPHAKARFKINILNKKNPYKNLDQLKKYFDMISYRQTHSEVRGFPETIYAPRYLEMGEEQRKLYERIKAETFKEIAKVPEKALNLNHVFVKTLRLRQMLSHPSILGENKVGSIKFDALELLLEEILSESESKVIIFSPHRDTLELIFQKYKDNYGCGIFAGISPELPSEERSEHVYNFLNNPFNRVLAANSKIGAGSNWQISRTIIYFDLSIRLEFIQACGRIQRRVATGPSIIIPFIVKNSIDELIYKQIKDKQGYVDQIIISDEPIINKDEILEALK